MRRTLIAVAALLGAITACSDNSPSARTGTMQMRLTDKPFPYDSVARADMFVVRIDAKLAEATTAETEDLSDDAVGDNPETEWVTVATPNASYNLLDLQNGTTTNLGQATIPTGTYRGFRLILDTDKSTVTLKNGTVLNGNAGIKWPSAGKTGVKVNLDQPISLTENGSIMVLDFDLGSSFVMRGGSISANGLLFKPVIRGTAQDITGTVSGSVVKDNATGAAVADATVELLTAGTLVTDTVSANVKASAKSSSTGAFTLAFVREGTYTLRVTPPATLTGYKPTLVSTVNVTRGTTTNVGPVVVAP